MAKALNIAVFTATRAEYGILKPVLLEIQNRAGMDLCLMVGGTHWLEAFGNTHRVIENDGFAIAEKIDFLKPDDDTALDIAQAVGRATGMIAQALERQKPDALVILGDRYELLAAASAALLMNVPIIHLFGGEMTQGAVDEQVRHAITKMAHIHCTPTEETGKRIRQMGEEPSRVFVTGHPALDALEGMVFPTRSDLEATLGGAFKDNVYLVTFHPETLNGQSGIDDLDALLGALSDTAQDATVLITHPNADAGHAAIIARLKAFVATMPDARLFESLGQQRYYGTLKIAQAMIGNSSSGLLEAPSFDCPAINIGDRQKGRIRASSVIDMPADRAAIAAAITSLKDRDFTGTVNPYAKKGAVGRVVDAIATLRDTPDILIKRFVDIA